MRTMTTLTVAAIATTFAISAHAASMATFDTDGNGSVNLEEFIAAFDPAMEEEQFNIIDSNSDGMIDDTEWVEASSDAGLLAGK